MNDEAIDTLAAALLAEFKRQEEEETMGYVSDKLSLDKVMLDGFFDLKKLAEVAIREVEKLRGL